MKCPHCGFENEEDEKVCVSCGKWIHGLMDVPDSEEESENNKSYGAVYHIERKEDQEKGNGGESDEESETKEQTYSKDWREELKQRVKEIKEKKKQGKKDSVESTEEEALEEEMDSEEVEEAEEEKTPVKAKKPTKKQRPAAKKQAPTKEEPNLFSMEEDEEKEESSPPEPSESKKEFPDEKAYPDDLKDLVEEYEPLSEEVYEEPLKEEEEEKAVVAAETDIADKEVIVKSRFFAGVFDLMILAILYLAIVYSTIKIMGINYLVLLKSAPIPLTGLLLLLSLAYFVYFTGFSGQTIGKMALKIRVISNRNGRVSFPMAFLRWIGYLISAGILFLGFLWITFDNEARGWHDKIAGTRVEIYY
jgi:uncharacterized RDD family membrane protein YckC